MPTPHPLLITLGDPAGIGPEIALAAWREEGDGVLVGSVEVLRRAVAQAAARSGSAPLAVAVLDDVLEPAPPGAVPIWQPEGLPAGLALRPQGQVHADNGAAAARCIEAAVGCLQAGRGRALVTAPLHKEALHAAGVDHPGHTEMLQALAGGVPVRMMLANPELRVVLVTVHMALREAVAAISSAAVLQTVQIADASLRRSLGRAPRIAVAGLNPHAGEGGLFGREEIEHIEPAVAEARRLGIEAQGPFAPDTIFMRARRGEFDVVVAMTHDQGLIPVKYLGVDDGVNTTLGLPFVRTSPDHGTAFDIAGQGLASAASLCAAWRMARALSAAPTGAQAA